MASDLVSVKTVGKNAQDFIEYANAYLAAQGVTDSDGNVAKFTTLAGSPSWIMALAFGRIATECQEAVRNAQAAYDITACSSAQVLNNALIAGVQRRAGSPSRIVVNLTNTHVSKTITVNRATIWTDAQAGKLWAVESSVEVPAGTTTPTTCAMACIEDGANTLSQGVTLSNSSYTTIVAQVSLCYTGSAVESISQLRERILLGGATVNPLVSCEEAITKLQGIVSCSIFFNRNSTSPKVLQGGIVLPARTAFITIRGVDVESKLAETYFTYMSSPTLETEGCVSTRYERGTEAIMVHYKVADEQLCHIRVCLASGSVAGGADQRVKNALLAHSGSLAIGAKLSEVQVAMWLTELSDLSMETIDLSTDDTVYTDVIQANAYSVFIWSEDTIHITESE